MKYYRSIFGNNKRLLMAAFNRIIWIVWGHSVYFRLFTQRQVFDVILMQVHHQNNVVKKQKCIVIRWCIT